MNYDDNELQELKEWNFFIAGVQHHDYYKCLDEMKVGDFLKMTAEPTNRYDPNAIRLEFPSKKNQEDIMVGYVKGNISAEVTALTITSRLSCQITELNKDAKPWEMIKVCVKEEA